MSVELTSDEAEISPLESFVRDYIETAGGVWDQVEPRVYDLLLPSSHEAAATGDAQPVLRVTFDPEALAEHPRSQLASLGTPLIDRLLADALHRGQLVELHLLGLNLQPHQLAGKAARAIKLADGLELNVHHVRPLDFPQLICWFEATFIADQREQEILPLAVDLHYGREVRHLDVLLDPARLAETPSAILPEAPGVGRGAAYRIARDQVLRSVASLANNRARELSQRVDRQVARMGRYYDDMRLELDEQSARAAARDADPAKFESRRAALAHERALRIAELRKKSTLRAQLRLLNVLVVHQPKLQIQSAVVRRALGNDKPGQPLDLTLVWDPLIDMLEPPACQVCGHPSFELGVRQTLLVCSPCAAVAASSVRRLPR